MPIKSRQIVPLVGFALCGYLALSGGMNNPKSGNFARKVRELPAQSDYSCPPLPAHLRNPFMTEGEWNGTKYVPSVLPSRLPVQVRPKATPKPSTQASTAPLVPFGIRQMSLTGVLLGPQQRSAVVNGEVITEGDRVGAYRVTKIELDRIHLSKDGEETILQLPDQPPPPLWDHIDSGYKQSTQDGPIPVIGSPPPARKDGRTPR